MTRDLQVHSRRVAKLVHNPQKASFLTGLMRCEYCGMYVSVVGKNKNSLTCGGRKKGKCRQRSPFPNLSAVEEEVKKALQSAVTAAAYGTELDCKCRKYFSRWDKLSTDEKHEITALFIKKVVLKDGGIRVEFKF
ncbi:MAG: zinc ribbon domain-containing protein [Oscillospiraceae bacterium]|jgi:hypothetical protein|nr:zinc ribbon domain-containing protein [Oscillospiraceae bacterium]